MKTVLDSTALKEQLDKWRYQGDRIGFVPTMGNLHAGHISLIDLARQQCDKVVCSVFVNPTQFGPTEDFNTYPRTLEDDSEKLAAANCDLLFAPNGATMYPEGLTSTVSIIAPDLTNMLCGASRPHFFNGITRVVSKLFHMVMPDKAYFGQKDYQQLLIIKTMTEALSFPIEIIGGPIIREPDGLAMSSRNQYLANDQRNTALLLFNALKQAESDLRCGALTLASSQIQEYRLALFKKLEASGFIPDYFEIKNRKDLSIAKEGVDKALLILIAADLNGTRLIDNRMIDL